MLKNYSKVKVDELGNKQYHNEEGQLHRLDGPAVEFGGSKFWYINGNSHRNIDPSFEWWDEEKAWHFNNKRHRIGHQYNSKYVYWYILGEQYSKQDYFNIVWDI